LDALLLDLACLSAALAALSASFWRLFSRREFAADTFFSAGPFGGFGSSGFAASIMREIEKPMPATP
jgi:hypothetical protein